MGSFQPQTPLSVFIGKAGTNVNGTWRLRMVDQYAQDVGTLQCWSLFLSPAQCKDGGGECPGADLALRMTAQPNPVLIGNILTYSITVTNSGPSSARNVIVSHLLPSSVIFSSASCSQGSWSQAGGLVTCYLGTIAAGGQATVTVAGMPTTEGTISSTANVTSNEADPNPANNSATVLTQVIPPTADLAVGLSALPNPAVINETITCTVSVTNNGPSDGSGIIVANVLPGGLAILSATVSQGSITTGGGLWTIGNLGAGARATATIVAIPTLEGAFVATSTAQGNQADANPANNSAALNLRRRTFHRPRHRHCGQSGPRGGAQQSDLRGDRDQPGTQRGNAASPSVTSSRPTSHCARRMSARGSSPGRATRWSGTSAL